MGRRLAGTLAVVVCCALGVFAPAAGAAKSCPEPEANWERATPAEAGMDAAALQGALDYGSSNLGFAVRVYRRGCLVGEDRLAQLNRNARFESWSMAKSVTSMLFGRALTLKLISPEDPVGALLPEADAAHGEITMRHLLTMTSGLRWNGFRDYNIFTMPDAFATRSRSSASTSRAATTSTRRARSRSSPKRSGVRPARTPAPSSSAS